MHSQSQSAALLQVLQIIPRRQQRGVDQVVAAALDAGHLHCPHQRRGDVRHQHERQLVAAVAPDLADVFGKSPDAPVERIAAAADHDAGAQNDQRQLSGPAHLDQDVLGRGLGARVIVRAAGSRDRAASLP